MRELLSGTELGKNKRLQQAIPVILLLPCKYPCYRKCGWNKKVVAVIMAAVSVAGNRGNIIKEILLISITYSCPPWLGGTNRKTRLRSTVFSLKKTPQKSCDGGR